MDKNAIIETLDYLFEKFGIAIDWTTENVIPYVQQLAENIVTYKIVTNSIWSGISVITIIICCICAKILYTNYKQCVVKKETNFIWKHRKFLGEDDFDLTGLGCTLCVLTPSFSIVSIITLICSLSSLIQWIFIPELQLIEYVSNLVCNAQM